MSICKAAVAHGAGQPVTVEDAVITAPRAGEVLMRIAGVGVTDLAPGDRVIRTHPLGRINEAIASRSCSSPDLRRQRQPFRRNRIGSNGKWRWERACGQTLSDP